jgi:hypothetical protein
MGLLSLSRKAKRLLPISSCDSITGQELPGVRNIVDLMIELSFASSKVKGLFGQKLSYLIWPLHLLCDLGLTPPLEMTFHFLPDWKCHSAAEKPPTQTLQPTPLIGRGIFKCAAAVTSDMLTLILGIFRICPFHMQTSKDAFRRFIAQDSGTKKRRWN